MVTKDAAVSEPPVPRRPVVPTTLAGKVLSLLRGDKYMVDAYPPAVPPTKEH
jgi:hypothetical protein